MPKGPYVELDDVTRDQTLRKTYDQENHSTWLSEGGHSGGDLVGRAVYGGT